MNKFKNNNLKALVIICLLLVLLHSLVGTISLKNFMNLKALEIIIAGILISTFISHSFDTVVFTINTIKSSFNIEIDYAQDISIIYNYAIKVKKKGALNAQSEIAYLENRFLRDALTLIIDYVKPQSIRDILEKDIESRRTKLFKAYNVLKLISQTAPAFGLIGTLLGMIGLLSHMDNPKLIMSNMSSALVSTLYGALIANFIAVPLMGRVKDLIDKKTLQYRIITEGVLLIAQNDSVRNVFDKMNVMLPDDMRLDYKEISKERTRGLNEVNI